MTTDTKFYTSDKEMPIFVSEELEPFAARCLGRWFVRCEVARKVKEDIQEKCKAEQREMTFYEYLDSEKFFRECSKMWWGLAAINRISIVTEGAVHFSIACSNEQRRVSKYIRKYLGFCPISDKEKAKELGFISE